MFLNIPKGANRPAKDALANAKKFRFPQHLFECFIGDFLESVGTPVALSIAILYRNKEFAQIANYRISPADYLFAADFQLDFQAISFLRKFSGMRTGIDTKAVAIDTFMRMETHCSESNRRISRYLSGQMPPSGVEFILNSAIRKIERCLGSFDVDSFLNKCGWGPGVTHIVKGDDTSWARKFDEERCISKRCYDLFGDIFRDSFPGWWRPIESSLIPTESCKIVTVPKNCLTDRTIGIEPGINIFCQKGVGSMIRGKLRRCGYNLDSTYQSHLLAFTGSKTNLISTIDFSSASDSLSVELVRLLLPPKWFRVMDALRCHSYSLNDTVHHSSKFSTMGNGFTFELESLIFVFLAEAATEFCLHTESKLHPAPLSSTEIRHFEVCSGVDSFYEAISVHGDDITIGTPCFSAFKEACSFLGLVINETKSFTHGNFRESCGEYYFNGADVKPVFLRSKIVTIRDVFHNLNAITLLSTRFYPGFRDKRFLRCYRKLLESVPKSIRVYGPKHLGDGCIHVDRNDLHECDLRRSSNHWEGFLFPCFLNEALVTTKESEGLLLQALSREDTEISFGNSVPLRKRTRLILKRVFCHYWEPLGSFC